MKLSAALKQREACSGVSGFCSTKLAPDWKACWVVVLPAERIPPNLEGPPGGCKPGKPLSESPKIVNVPVSRRFFLDSPAVHRETSSVGEIVFLSLGSNLGDRAANLRAALAQLEAAGRLLAVSALYETQPLDVPDQPWFLNCVAAMETEKTPRELLALALRTEAAMGRLRMFEKGPRNIDIDVVLFGDRVVDEPGLKIPHPSMHRRRFVLEPLAEIAPDARHPALEKTAQELLAELAELKDGQKVRRL